MVSNSDRYREEEYKWLPQGPEIKIKSIFKWARHCTLCNVFVVKKLFYKHVFLILSIFNSIHGKCFYLRFILIWIISNCY